MENRAERYNIIQEKSGLNKKDFAATLGLSKAMGYQISTGRLNPSDIVIEKLADLYNVNLHWFITGKGPSGLEGDIVEIELVDQEAAAGYGREIENYAEKRTFQVPRSLIGFHNPQKLQALSVVGDSMIGDNIHSGDIVIFSPGLHEGEGIYVVSVENTLLVKRVAYDPYKETIDLISSNPAYQARHFRGVELADIRVAGKVIGVFHRI
jgi:phage repressor protein C with HTH and peptisase S24 domain